MGWVSTFEDIEERRLESQLGDVFDLLIERAHQANSLSALRREQVDLENRSRRLVDSLQNKKREALEAFREATKIFRQPDVQIISRLEKREKQLETVRKKLGASEFSLRMCNNKRNELDAKLKNALQENTQLRSRIDELQNKLAWYEEMSVTKPLHRR